MSTLRAIVDSPVTAIVCTAVAFALMRWNSTRLESLTPRAAALSAAGLAALLGGLTVWAAVIVDPASLPYNVRELTGPYPFVAIGALGSAVAALGVAPVLAAVGWLRYPRLFARAFVPVLFAFASVIFVMLAAVAPTESIHDIVGAPVLDIGRKTERWLRFVALVAGPLAAMTLGARLAFGQWRAAWPAAMLMLLVVGATALVVVPFRATSNVAELLQGKGSVIAIFGGLMLGVLAGALAAAPVRDLMKRCTALVAVGRNVVVAILLLPAGWSLLQLTLNPRLDKYGATFSALQFLLSPNRQQYLAEDALFARSMALQVLLSIALLLAGAIVALVLTGAAWNQRRD